MRSERRQARGEKQWRDCKSTLDGAGAAKASPAGLSTLSARNGMNFPQEIFQETHTFAQELVQQNPENLARANKNNRTKNNKKSTEGIRKEQSPQETCTKKQESHKNSG